ncbi:MAG TPA: Fic family protein [Solirubrobacterales bacterium]
MIQKLGPEVMGRVVASQIKSPDDHYLHWDKLRHIDPPEGMSTDEWWLGIKARRSAETRFLPLADPSGHPFTYGLPNMVLKRLHLIDQRCSGEIAMDEVVTSERQAGQRFLVNSLMEEAIRSSQLEGATTSRRVAKEMLRSGRDPTDRSERMIVNNYRALQFMREEMGDTLSPDSVLELHRIITEGTLDDPSAAGRVQRPDEERVAVYDRDDDREPIHRPPPAEQLPNRMHLLCDFANEGDDSGQFIHPVVRAILLHFWLAYDHPFEDGNGRTARILFFWSMRTRGYWLAEYLPISRFIRKAPAQYARAFMETETDGGDTTYFLIHQLDVIERAIDDLHAYLQRKIAEVRDVEKLLQGSAGFNHRQLAVLTDAVRHPDASYSFASHATSHRVTHETARSDLSGLAERGLLRQRRRGRRYLFEPASDLGERLRESKR